MGDSGGRRGPALIAPPTAPAPAPVSARGLAPVAVAVLAVAAAVAVGLLRQPGPGALDTVWAEDGSVFLGQAVDQGPWPAFLTSYAGYFHLVPRLVGALAAAVPVGAAAAVLAVSAALCTALLALLVYLASAAHLSSQLSRILVSAGLVVVPVAQDEVLNSIANFHWYGLYAVFWVLLWSPHGRAGRAVAVSTVLLVAASDILVVAFVPLALFRAVRQTGTVRRDRLGIALAGALAAGLAVQVAGLLSGSSSRALAIDPMQAAAGYLLRAVPAPLIGQRWLGQSIDAGSLVLVGTAWLVVAAALVVALRGLTRPAWVLAGTAAVHSAVLYALPVTLSGVIAPRYAVAPAMLVVTALVALLQPARPMTRRPSIAPLHLLAGLLAVVALVNLRIDNPRADGPRWSDELDRARAACATHPAGDAALIVAPPRRPAWTVSMPCDHLD